MSEETGPAFEQALAAERRRMVEEQLASRDIHNPRVLEAMQAVPRHRFVPREFWPQAYMDGPLPIGEEQTISQPYIVALMAQILHLRGDERVLEVGTGSGYGAAVLGYLAREVYTLERHPPLARQAAETLRELGVNNVHVHVGDGTLGLPEFAPYDAISVTAAAPRIPPPLLDQLANGGRLVIPVGPPGEQRLERWQRRDQVYVRRRLAPVAFVPLLGQFGWKEDL